MAAIGTKDIARSIYEGSKDHKDQSSYFKNVVKFLAHRKLMSKVPEIILQLKKIINQEEGIIEANVSTATRLGATERYQLIQELKKRYSAKDVILHEVVDPEFLGGLRVEVQDEVIDLTIKEKISRLQTYLMRSV